MSRMIGFLKVVIASLAIGAPLALLLRALEAEPRELWFFLILLISGFLGSLFDKEGFWGDPHPFRRGPYQG